MLETNNQIHITFKIEYARFHQLYTFDISLSYQYNNDSLCLVYQHSVNSENLYKNFPITHSLERKKIKNTPDYTTLLAQAEKKKVTLGEAISIGKVKFDMLQLSQIYQDIEAINLKNIPPKNLIIYRIQPKTETRVYNAKYQKLS